jgi:ABC-type glycerol-3-phosphate transport system permease component
MIEKQLYSRLLDGINYLLLLIIAAACILPFIFIIASSLTAPEELLRKGFILFPTKFSLVGYKYILSTDIIGVSTGAKRFDGCQAVHEAGRVLDAFQRWDDSYVSGREGDGAAR